ncbi:MAG: serine hydrolase domain-containing protein [Bryobacteraceae bacterium]
MPRRLALLPLVVLLLRAQDDRAVVASRIDSAVQRIFHATRCPCLSVAVATNNTIIYSKALGFADIEQGVACTTDSAHRLASLSKLITATIIMDQVQSGRLKLDASIKIYLADLPAAYDHVTIRHLLSHQAGIREYRNLEEVFSTIHYPASRDALKAFVNDPLLFEPGTKTAYSSYGFTMLGAAAEIAAGKTFQDLSKDFFERHHIQGFDIDDPLAIVPHRVRGYLVDQKAVSNSRAYDASNKYPAGGFTASADTCLRFLIAVGSGQVLNPEILKQTWTRQKTRDGTASAFGLGWGVSTWEGRAMVGLNGLQPSTTTSARYFPEEGDGVVLLCNAEVKNAEGGQDLSLSMNNLLKIILK